MSKAFVQSAENNKGPILAVLRVVFADARHVLEIGSGTGQHAAYFATELPHLTWQPSDLPDCHADIEAWIESVDNASSPVSLNVDERTWPVSECDAVFSANTAHIIHWPSVVNMFRGVARILSPAGVFALYGPFNYGGTYTSPSNERFDASLRAADPQMGIRDFEAVDSLATECGLSLTGDYAMPANNRILVWRKPAQVDC